jgi:ubiquinone/menaquinone biosynthesis C-methylase UbiE
VHQNSTGPIAKAETCRDEFSAGIGDAVCSRISRYVCGDWLASWLMPQSLGGILSISNMTMNSRTFKAAGARRLDDPERLKWLPPQEAVSALSIAPGMTIADIGAGTGYFSLPFAQAAGPAGCVLAVDLQPEMLAILREKLASPGSPQNVQLRQGTAEHTGVPEHICDLVFLANIWHELDDHAAVLREAGRILKSEGLIAVLDWRRDLAGPPGPPADDRIAEAETVAALEHAGSVIRRAGAFGWHSYLVLGTRPSASVQAGH